jgi:hypothetical protein
VPLRPERVVEVRYDHLEGRRFRHTAQFLRWRPDRDPRSCTYDQLEETIGYDLADVLATTTTSPSTYRSCLTLGKGRAVIADDPEDPESTETWNLMNGGGHV